MKFLNPVPRHDRRQPHEAHPLGEQQSASSPPWMGGGNSAYPPLHSAMPPIHGRPPFVPPQYPARSPQRRSAVNLGFGTPEAASSWAGNMPEPDQGAFISPEDLVVLWRLTDGDPAACAELAERLRGVAPRQTLQMLKGLVEGGTSFASLLPVPDRLLSCPDPWLAMRFGPEFSGTVRVAGRTAPPAGAQWDCRRSGGAPVPLPRVTAAGKPRAPPPRTPPNVLREPFLRDDALNLFLRGAA